MTSFVATTLMMLHSRLLAKQITALTCPNCQATWRRIVTSGAVGTDTVSDFNTVDGSPNLKADAKANPWNKHRNSEKEEKLAKVENARPFEEIPGPKGLPLIGHLLQYGVLGT